MKNVIKINKSRVKVLYLKNKNITFDKYMSIKDEISIYEQVYLISFYDSIKEKLFDYYDKKIREDGKYFLYSDLFIFISLCISLEKYHYMKETYDILDKSSNKIIISINYSIIEYYLFFSDYKSILKLLYALSMCREAKKYILKQTLKYLQYMTDVDDELIRKMLRNVLNYDLFFSYKLYKGVTNNLNISLKEGIYKYYGIPYEEFEDLAYRRVSENKYLIVISELYKDKYNATIEDFYNNLDKVFEKIKLYDKDRVTELYKYIQREFFLFIVISNYSKYEKYKKDLFDILKSELFRPSYVYHSIDTFFKITLENGKIIELLDNMPNNFYGYSEDVISNSIYYKYCKHDYLKYNYKNVFDYLKKYNPEEIIRIYMNTSMKLVIGFDEVIKYIKDNYMVDIDISNYYFYGTVSLNYMNKYELKITNILFNRKVDLTNNEIINNLHSYYLDNTFKIRFKCNSNFEIGNIEYVSKDGTIISFYDRCKDEYESASLGRFKSKQISYVKNSSNDLLDQIYEEHLNGLNINDFLVHVSDNRYVRQINYLENLLKAFSKLNSKDEFLTFISKIGKNNIFNDSYNVYYPIYLFINNFDIYLYKKIIYFKMNLEEAIHIFLNSPLKYLYLISDFLKDYFKINKARCSLVDLSNYNIVIDCFILEKEESHLVEFNGKKFNVYIDDSKDFGFAKIKLTKYEVFTGKLYGHAIRNEIEKINIKSEYEKALNNMKNFKIGDDFNKFNYLYTYRAGTFNINDYIMEYYKIVSDNLLDLNYLYEFFQKNSLFNIFNSNKDYGELKNNLYLRGLKEKFDCIFRINIYDESILEKKIYISENSFIKNPLRKMVRAYLKKIDCEKYEFKNSKRIKLKVKETGELILAFDEYRNNYSLKFDMNYNIDIGNYIIVDLLEYNNNYNYFKAKLVSIYNEENDIERRFALYINDILDILTNILYDDGENFSYYLEKLSKYGNEDIKKLNISYKKKEYFELYFRIFKKYIYNFEVLNKILLCMEKLNPFDLFNNSYKIGYFDKKELIDLAYTYIDNARSTEHYFDALNIYFNSFISKYVPLKKLKEVFISNENEKFNMDRNAKTLFIKYKKDDLFYLKTYCNKLKIPVKNCDSKYSFMFFKIKKRDIEGEVFSLKYMKSFRNIEEISGIKS